MKSLVYGSIIAGCLFLSSCSSFGYLFGGTDTTPAVRAVMKMEDIGVNSLDTLKELVTNSTGLEEGEKLALLDKIAGEKSKFTILSKELKGYLGDYGEIDWKAVALDALDMYIRLRGEKN